MQIISLFILLLLWQFIWPVGSADTSGLINERRCVGPTLRLDNNGIIVSHRSFGKTAHPSQMNCEWIIRAPFDHRIMLQVIYFQLEQEWDCSFDSLTVWESTEQPIHERQRLCGGGVSHIKRFISESNRLYLHFMSDNNVEKWGFLLRYAFIGPNDPAVLQNSLDVMGRPCFPWEVSCAEITNSKSTCISKAWQCDHINDCPSHHQRDKSLDESKASCPIASTSCHHSQFSCGDKECVPKRYWCDGEQDCTDGSDEAKCHSDGNVVEEPVLDDEPLTTTIMPTTFAPPPSNNCGLSKIEPDGLKVGNESIPTDDEAHIVGGREARPNSWPWMLSLRSWRGHFCGATLISPKLAVTAAHCLVMGSRETWRLDAGRHNETSWQPGISQRRRLSQVIVHPLYNDKSANSDYDIAILVVERPFLLTDYITPVCLKNTENDQEQNDAESLAVILGWGQTQGSGGEGVLKQAQVPLVSNEQCNEWYGDVNSQLITDRMICAGFEHGGVDACAGDSGGPLLSPINMVESHGNRVKSITRWYLTGITSWGDGCAKARRPGVYARLSSFIGWIQMYLEEFRLYK